MFEDYLPTLRVAAFVGFFAIFAALEWRYPRRQRRTLRRKRWVANLGLAGSGVLVLRVLIPAGAAGIAVVAAEHHLGLLAWLEAPMWLNVIVGVVILDLAIYAQHVAMHRWTPLWRLHRVHHADVDLDVSSGVRFHPGEILFSFAYKLVFITLLGVAWQAVIVFEILLNASAMFNHANWKIPQPIDLWLRTIIVTPDLHRVHHSTALAEQQRNYGFFLSVWDRVFRTLQNQPHGNHANMDLGLGSVAEKESSSLASSLLLPIKSIR